MWDITLKVYTGLHASLIRGPKINSKRQTERTGTSEQWWRRGQVRVMCHISPSGVWRPQQADDWSWSTSPTQLKWPSQDQSWACSTKWLMTKLRSGVMKTTDSTAAGAWNADRERDAETGPMKTEGLTRSVHGDKGLTAGLLWWPAGCSRRSTQHRGPRMSDMNGTHVKKHWQDPWCRVYLNI